MDLELLTNNLLNLLAAQDTDAVFGTRNFIDSLPEPLELIGIQLAACASTRRIL